MSKDNHTSRFVDIDDMALQFRRGLQWPHDFLSRWYAPYSVSWKAILLNGNYQCMFTQDRPGFQERKKGGKEHLSGT